MDEDIDAGGIRKLNTVRYPEEGHIGARVRKAVADATIRGPRCPSVDVNPAKVGPCDRPQRQSRVSRYHRWVTRHPVRDPGRRGASWGRWRPSSPRRLQLKTAFEELLPSNDPGVVTLERTQKRMGDLSLLLIGVRSPDHEAEPAVRRGADQEAAGAAPRVVNLATYEIQDLAQFFQDNKWLYVSEDDLESIRDRLRNEISKRKNPLFVSLDDEEPIDQMQKRLGRATRSKSDSRAGCSPAPTAVRLDRRAAARRPIRRARGRGAVQRRPRADRRGPARRSYHPQ